MANRRMINKGITTSEQVNSLPLECQLLFTWMITHADDDGRMKGSAVTVRGLVFPLKEYSVSEVEIMLQKIKEAGLIWRWSVGSDTYIQFPKWKRHQQIRSDRYHPSEIPSYESNGNQLDTTVIPNDNQMDTQYKEVEDSLDKGNKEENKLRELESEEEPTVSTKTPQLHSLGEHTAYRAWQLLDHDNPDVLERRYLQAVRDGISSGKILLLAQEISKDNSVVNKGREFEKRIKQLLKQNTTEEEKK